MDEEDIETLARNTKDRPGVVSWNLFYSFTNFKITCKSYERWEKVKWLIANLISNPLPELIPEYPVSYEVQHSDDTILIAGCGNSYLSEFLFQSGFDNIISVDFADAVIEHMQNKCSEATGMKWQVMDLTKMDEFQNETFDAIVDVGGLDSVMDDHSDGVSFGHLYISEVKRLLKTKGKYVCMTLGESKVIDTILPRFRIGWKVNTFSIDEEENVFIIVASKLADHSALKIATFRYPVGYDHQAAAFHKAIINENHSRAMSIDSFSQFIPLEDLKANLKELESGRRIRLTLGQPGASTRFYNCFLLDAQQDSGPFSVQLLVFIVPNSSHYEWITQSSKEQWLYAEYFKTARFLMVMVSPTNDLVSNEDIKKDVSRLVSKVAPANCDDHKIMYVNATDLVRITNVHQVESDLSGLIAVENFYYRKNKNPSNKFWSGRFRCFSVAKMERSRVFMPTGTHGSVDVDYSHLESAHHNAIASGIQLMCVHWMAFSAQGRMKDTMYMDRLPHNIKTTVIGLGSGILPMFIKQSLPHFTTEVVEPDSVILDIARKYFEFRDEGIKVHINNGIEFVKERANRIEGSDSSKIDVLIIDMVSPPHPKSDLVSPRGEFVERKFLLNVKDALSEDGFLVMNLVTRSASVKRSVYGSLKEIFSNLVYLPIEEDVSDVIFAFNSDFPTTEEDLSDASVALAKSLAYLKTEWIKGSIDASKLFRPH